ncbi:TRADD-N-associated membrane domain-containing protein [Glaciimonas sp. GNP009]
MSSSPYISILHSLLKAWQGGHRRVRATLILIVVLVLSATLISALAQLLGVDKKIIGIFAATLALAAGIALLGVLSYQSLVDQQVREEKIETVEERLREHPERPQLAWDLARIKLENYLDRNLSQVRSIYWLTLIVMFCGFGFVMYGLFQASTNPDKLAVSIVASASGVLISFIGGSFLLIYRSILSQSKEYVTVLERINAVGMAVQVIASIPDTNSDLKSQTKAELAKQLLSLYAMSPPSHARAMRSTD